MDKKYLIINADDFGACSETNTAIKELYLSGKITSTSLLAVAPATDEALEIAKANDIKVGVHWAFNSDYDNDLWKPVTAAHSLTDENGFFYRKLSDLRKHAKSREITSEGEAQYQKIVDAGVTVDHADSHCGTLYGIIGRLFFYNAFDMCAKFDLPFRLPYRPDFLTMYLGGDKVNGIVKAVYKSIIKKATKRSVRLIDDMICNNRDAKDMDGYKDLENYYLTKLRNIKPGVTEFFTHPSYDCPRLDDGNWAVRLYDLEFLNSDKLARLIADEGIELVTYDQAGR